MYTITENFMYTRSFGYIRTLHIFITVFTHMQEDHPQKTSGKRKCIYPNLR